jgi:DNA-binding PadR family transcriptional regulator
MRTPDIGFATFSLDDLALGLVMVGPNHGYQLYQLYQQAFGEMWAVGRSKFYAALAGLEERALLDSVVEMQSDRPPRKIYQVTEHGHSVFMHWLYQPVKPVRAIRVELIAKLRFFNLLNLPDSGQLLDAQTVTCREVRRRWQQKIEDLHQKGGDPVLECLYDFRFRQADFILDWLLAWRNRLTG